MRPNHYPRLVFYLYYIKFARLRDLIVFRHIDINIPEFLKIDKSGNIIQENVFLNDETIKTRYIITILDIYKRLKK